jgi:hypothetical protein
MAEWSSIEVFDGEFPAARWWDTSGTLIAPVVVPGVAGRAGRAARRGVAGEPRISRAAAVPGAVFARPAPP